MTENNAAPETGIEDLIAINEGRAKTYGLLARLYREECSQELIDELYGLKWRVSTGNDALDRGHKLVATWLSGLWDNSKTELSADYMRTFFGHGYSGHAAAYPFESVYASEKRLLMQGARDEILALYRAAGLDKQDSWKEGEDHIALELEFMQRMAMRTADALRAGDEDAAIEHLRTQRTFAQDHLLNWLPMMTEDMRRFSRTMFYQGLAQLVMGYAEEDAAVLDELLDSVE